MTVTLDSKARDGSTLPRVRAVSRAVSILRAFTADRPHLGLSEIVRATGLDAGTTRRLLVTLRDDGLVQQDTASGAYALSLGILELSSAVPETVSLKGIAERRLIQLAAETGTTVYLSALRGNAVMCVARYHGEAAVKLRWWGVGETLAINCGAGPRVILAHLPTDQQATLLSGPLDRLSDRSITDADTLRAKLADIRARGWEVTEDEVELGLSAIAVPLINATGEVIAAISIGGLTPRIVGPRQDDLVAALQAAARDLRADVRSLRA